MGLSKGQSLVIVESPSKARTIERYLGPGFKVLSTVGHIRDLPSSRLGVEIDNDFRPTYEVIRGKGKVIEELRRAARASDCVYLAPDPDREGEAIAWHIAAEIEGRNEKVCRVTFNEITAAAVREAIANPSEINQNLVNAQQARRVLDRLVGYSISPLLWQKVQKGLSAGRVQSVAVRLICEREREIEAFVPREYWTIEALVEKEGQKPPFIMKLAAIEGKKVEIGTKAEATAIVEDVKGEEFKVDRIVAKEVARRPYPPFTTSTLQQEAVRKLGFTTRMTDRVAQQLYEGVEIGAEGPTGLVTYIRTDSTRVASLAQQAARQYVTKTFGPQYAPEKPNVYPSRAGAQDAHEAIRPTSMDLAPEAVAPHLSREQGKLYRLIWNRFVASQMAAARIEQTRVESLLKEGRYTFSANGSVILFPGFLAVYEESKEEKTEEDEEAERNLPRLEEGDALRRKSLEPIQHFTQPPPRYTESSLVKELESQRIGRPSTYSAIIQTIQDRKYVQKEKRRFKPTERGNIVTELLVENFPKIMDVKFTALMEDQLDQVEEGKVNWVNLLRNFYGPFREWLDSAERNMRNVRREVVDTDIVCEKCGAKMVIRWGRNGRFLACSAFPRCRNTKPFESDGEGKVRVVAAAAESSETCEKCGAAMVIKTGRRGRFLACSAYPKCANTRPVPISVKCPVEGCAGQLVERRSKNGKTFYGCDLYPKCRFTVWEHPRQEFCEQCQETVKIVGSVGKEKVFACPRADCPYENVVGDSASESL